MPSEPRSYLIDMDGVLVHGRTPIPGAKEFLAKLKAGGHRFLVLTNNPRYTPGDLSYRLGAGGLDVPASQIFTSAMAMALFLKSQRPSGTVFAIGDSGLTSALHEAGYILTDHHPDYVALGETDSFDMALITKAIRLVKAGSRFVATNPDPSGPAEAGIVPACGAVAAMIQTASGVAPFFVGKPNPLMMRMALNYIGAHSENTTMIGDRMDTDIIAGVETGLETVLALTGIATREDALRYPFLPTRIIESIAELDP
ncbi:MAG: HAD family hydrolase [Armatimonadetes bacterium]|nr:HAD family hydrolase [Armatimonadota bacterium]